MIFEDFENGGNYSGLNLKFDPEEYLGDPNHPLNINNASFLNSSIIIKDSDGLIKLKNPY